jgi:dolichol-phosphate mannosyltransferase
MNQTGSANITKTEGDLNAKSEIGLILPTYCEVSNIEKLICDIENLNLDIRLLVIDDSSPDRTADAVRELQKKYKNILLLVRSKKSGLGTAITDGFRVLLSLKNPPSYIVTMDADYSHNPKDVPRAISTAKEGRGLAIGSRYCKGGGVVKWSMFRRLTSRVANILAYLLVRARIHDYTSGLRCYSTRLVKEMVPDLHSQTYEIQIETIRQARKRGFEVREFPMTFVNRKNGKSKLSANEIKEFTSYIFRIKKLKSSAN